jgi:hypothetical protein
MKMRVIELELTDFTKNLNFLLEVINVQPLIAVSALLGYYYVKNSYTAL